MPFSKPAAATIAGVATLAAAALVPAGAQATVACTFNSGPATAAVTMDAQSDSALIARNAGGAILVNGTQCQAATVSNTDLIRVDGSANNFQSARFDLSAGPLGPGKTSEGGGNVSEIELEVDLRTGNGEEIAVTGNGNPDTFGFGTAGAKVNADGDLDLTYGGIDQVELDGNGGADTLSAGGTVGGTGSPMTKFADIDGGDAADTLTGGRTTDTIIAGADASNDTVAGGQGNDTLRGGAGNDTLRGEAGFDTIEGDLGDDQVFGGQDNDSLNLNGGSAPDGADVMSGGPGPSDFMYLGTRIANVIVKLDGNANDGADAAADGTAEEGDNIRPDIERVETGPANDLIDARFATARQVGHSLDGNGGHDRIFGGDEVDTLSGDAGDDTLDSGDWDDSLSGGLGADSLIAGDGEDTLDPGTENDNVDGGAGDDYLEGGTNTSGADNYVGGAGFDRVYYGSRTSPLDIVANNNPDDGFDLDGTPGGEEGDNVRADIEYVDTGSGADLINFATGPANAVAADNLIVSRDGADTIMSGLGEDTINAAGPAASVVDADTITAGPGTDTASGGAGADRFVMNDKFFDSIDGGAGDGATDTGNFDSIDERLNFP